MYHTCTSYLWPSLIVAKPTCISPWLPHQMSLSNIHLIHTDGIHVLWSTYCLLQLNVTPCEPLSKDTLQYSSVHFSRSVVSNSLQPYNSEHSRPPCPAQTLGVYSNSCPSNLWCHPAISSSVVPFSSCPQSLLVSGSFPMSQLFAWSGQSIGVSASISVLPMNNQDWSALWWTGWISLQSKGLSRVFNTTVQSINFSTLSFLHSPTLTSIHDHWKNHSLDQTDLCWQSNVSAF